eukprot:2635545-Pyramimonas_sp.AAC.1
MRGFDLDDPTINPTGRSRDRPREDSDVLGVQIMWHAKEDCHLECPSCKKNYGQDQHCHLRTPGKYKFGKPWKLPDNHGQVPQAPAEPATPPPEAPAAPPLVRLRAPRRGSRAGPTAGASSHGVT